MRSTSWFFGITALVLGAAATVAAQGAKAGASRPVGATATIEGRSGTAVNGHAVFTASGGKVTMKVRASGLTPGTHAIHLHEKGDCSDPEAKAAGGHWNPANAQHGHWGEGSFHRGDIGNLQANAAGEAILEFTTDQWTVGGDPGTDVVGRSVVIHEKADDFKTQPTGNAGGRVGCGVIKALR